MSERKDADKLAERLLNEPNADPDDDLRMLSRQLLRRRDVIDRLEKRLAELSDGTLDLVNANRDTILRITEDGIRRLFAICGYIHISLAQSDSIPPIVLNEVRKHCQLALAVIEAVNTFHPMHGESWSGFPAESDPRQFGKR